MTFCQSVVLTGAVYISFFAKCCHEITWHARCQGNEGEKMEKKYWDRLIGHQSKIVTREPGEKNVSVVYGEIEAIDYDDGFVFVKSDQGEGYLSLKTILAIKPRGQPQKKSIVNDHKAMVGIGTLIVFIAMILVAAVAAGVIIQSSEGLQQQAQSVATETTREVSAGLVIDGITGYTNEQRTLITHLALSVRPRSGSDEIDLANCVLSILYDDLCLLTVDESLVVPVNLDNKSVFETPVQSGSEVTLLESANQVNFGIIAIHDPDESVTRTCGMNSGDRIYIIINLSSLIPDEGGLPCRSTISGDLKPETGAAGTFEVRSPSVFSRRIVSLL